MKPNYDELIENLKTIKSWALEYDYFNVTMEVLCEDTVSKITEVIKKAEKLERENYGLRKKVKNLEEKLYKQTEYIKFVPDKERKKINYE